MSYFIGWCHDAGRNGEASCRMGPLGSYVGRHWHYWNGTDMTAGVVGAKKFETDEEAEVVLAGILLLHPERLGSMTIEMWRSALDRGRA